MAKNLEKNVMWKYSKLDWEIEMHNYFAIVTGVTKANWHDRSMHYVVTFLFNPSVS